METINNVTAKVDKICDKIDSFVKKGMMSSAGSIFGVDKVDKTQLDLLAEGMVLLHDSKELMMEEAKILDRIPEMDKKLDTIIKQLETEKEAREREEIIKKTNKKSKEEGAE